MFFCDFPIIGEESGMPLYLVNMGKHICQPETVREEGYHLPQILYCTKGSGVLQADGKSFDVPAGTGVFLPANCPHRYYPTDDEWDVHWVVPDGYAVSDMLSYFGLEKTEVFSIGDIALIEHFFSRMHEAIRGDHINGNLRASGYLYSFLIEIARQKNTSARVVTSNRAITAAVDHINNCYESKITMEDLCSAAGLSKQQLCRLFNRYLNARPMEYVAKRRIQASKELLSSTDMSVEDIAEKVGFCSGSYFCKLFTRYEGMTPTRFRHI